MKKKRLKRRSSSKDKEKKINLNLFKSINKQLLLLISALQLKVSFK